MAKRKKDCPWCMKYVLDGLNTCGDDGCVEIQETIDAECADARAKVYAVKSLVKVDLDEIASLESTRARIDAEICSLKSRVREELSSAIGIKYHHLHVGRFWECNYSPTGHCLYDTFEDPCMDGCILCGQPSERK